MRQMKKFLIILVTAAAFTACNNDAGSAEDKKDSTVNTIDSTAGAKKDSVENRADSIKNKIDSTAGAKKDSVKKK
jgi:predicted small secreted protein